MKTDLLIAIRLTLATLVLFGVIYPLVITGVASLIPGAGEGRTIVEDGKVLGFEVIGQSFTSDKYFNSRPSAVGYNAAATGGSNKGPSNPDYLKQVEDRITDFLQRNPDVKREDIPVDLVTASGGGLDPHISIAAAKIQIPRIAHATTLSTETLMGIIAGSTEGPLLGLFGPGGVNVLKANLAIEESLRNK